MSKLAPIGVAVAGATGRMGRALLQGLQQSPALRLQGALVAAGSPWIGQDAGSVAGLGALGVPLTASIAEALAHATVLIDFTTPQATLQHLAYCRQRGIAMVIGTTGWAAIDQQQIVQAAQQIALLQSANFSLGIQVLYQLAEIASRILGAESDIDILDKHHRHKRDAPSGTALALGERVANGMGLAWPACRGAVHDGVSAGREAGKIHFAALRTGQAVGEHTVLFTLAEEQLSITHQATSRRAFSQGALRAAQWLAHQPAAYYTLQDLLESSF